MVAEGEDWKSVEIPTTEGNVASPTARGSVTPVSEEETTESKPSGGNSNV